MSKPQSRKRSQAQLLAELVELKTARDWSWDRIADAIEAITGIQRHGSAFHKLVTGERRVARPSTIRAIERFLDAQPRQEASR